MSCNVFFCLTVCEGPLVLPGICICSIITKFTFLWKKCQQEYIWNKLTTLNFTCYNVLIQNEAAHNRTFMELATITVILGNFKSYWAKPLIYHPPTSVLTFAVRWPLLSVLLSCLQLFPAMMPSLKVLPEGKKRSVKKAKMDIITSYKFGYKYINSHEAYDSSCSTTRAYPICNWRREYMI